MTGILSSMQKARSGLQGRLSDRGPVLSVVSQGSVLGTLY